MEWYWCIFRGKYEQVVENIEKGGRQRTIKKQTSRNGQNRSETDKVDEEGYERGVQTKNNLQMVFCSPYLKK